MCNSHRKSNKMQQCMKILFHIYMKLNMFRVTHRPLSRAKPEAADGGRYVARNVLSFIQI
jgi:hypothetical protein